MHPVDAFLHAIDAAWGESASPRALLRILGSTALFLQTDYDRGTQDSDVLETNEITSLKDRLLRLAGKDSDLHRRHRMYVDGGG